MCSSQLSFLGTLVRDHNLFHSTLGKLKLREVMMLLKQAATGPYSAFVWVTKRYPSPDRQSTWVGSGLGKQVTGWVPAYIAPL